MLQREDTTPATESGIECGVKTRRKERLDETMEMISPTKSWVVRCEFLSAYVCSANELQENETNKEQRSIMREGGEHLWRCRLVLRLKALWVLSPWKPRAKENGGSFYPYFYLGDQRFGASSSVRVGAKYGFHTESRTYIFSIMQLLSSLTPEGMVNGLHLYHASLALLNTQSSLHYHLYTTIHLPPYQLADDLLQ